VRLVRGDSSGLWSNISLDD